MQLLKTGTNYGRGETQAREAKVTRVASKTGHTMLRRIIVARDAGVDHKEFVAAIKAARKYLGLKIPRDTLREGDTDKYLCPCKGEGTDPGDVHGQDCCTILGAVKQVRRGEASE
jgi:hypothetical protein